MASFEKVKRSELQADVLFAAYPFLWPIGESGESRDSCFPEHSLTTNAFGRHICVCFAQIRLCANLEAINSRENAGEKKNRDSFSASCQTLCVLLILFRKAAVRDY